VHDYYHHQQNQLQNITTIFSVYGRFLDDMGLPDAYWAIDTTCVNFIEITQLDLECNEVRGNFEMHFKMVQQGQTGVLYSERINFNNGKFYSHITQY
jgi:hypothetical protein